MNVIFWIVALGAILWTVIILLYRFFDLKKHGLSLESGALLWRTRRGLALLDRIVDFFPKGWKALGIFGAGFGIVLMALMFINLAASAAFIFAAGGPGTAETGGVAFVIPGLTIPLVAGIIALSTVLLVHESAHGIIARRIGLPVKSAGLGLFLIIPLGFVEPDEDKLKKSSISERLQVYGAGSVANILFSLICLVMVLALIEPLPGLFVAGTVQNSPATGVFRQGDQIIKLDNFEIDDYRDLDEFMENTHSRENLTISTNRGEFKVTLENHPTENHGYIGVYLAQSVPRSRFVNPIFFSLVILNEIKGNPVINPYTYGLHAPWFLIDALKWMVILNLGIGLFNLLPLVPLDGGYIASCLVEKSSSRSKAKKIVRALSLLTLALLLMNLMPIFM